MRTADRAILGIGAIAAAHNMIAAGRHQQMISERVDDYRATAPILTDLALTLLWLHLTRRLPAQADPFTGLAVAMEKLSQLMPRRRRA